MNEAIQKALKQIEQARKPEGSVPWAPDEPYTQPLYTFNVSTHSWQETSLPSPAAKDLGFNITKLALFSWNIDFMLPCGPARMSAALAELEAQIARLPATTAAVVFLQECVEDDLEIVGAQGWVRAAFARTDLDATFWASGHYGTTTLVDRRLGAAGVFRVHYALTRMERDALFVDVAFPARVADGDKERLIRLCNTHLESLALEPAYRPPQAALAAKFMLEGSVHGALPGDLNAIQPHDRTLHSDNGLRDAYLELGGAEDSEDGYTWGQQAAPELRRAYGCSRMDKVWYCGGVAVEKFARFGADVEVVGEKEKEEIVGWGGFEKAWVTDHLGIVAEVTVLD